VRFRSQDVDAWLERHTEADDRTPAA
jgi:predicted DNA-binding transcriptional regulator AlpA